MRALGLAAVIGRRYGAAMNSTTTARPRAHASALPNILTYARIAAVPVVVGCSGECVHFVKPENVKVTKGADLVGHFMKTKMSDRQYCTKCGGHLMNNHPPLGLVDVYAATIPSVKFVPVVHVNYAETVLPMKDGLPKLKDFPPELGGSGEAVALRQAKRR